MVVAAILVVVLATIVVGTHGVRVRSTNDFLVASRSVRTRVNAMAVAGEYLSAASFLGVASLILQDGIGALWYPIGFTAGYLTLLVCVAAPLRRFGAYTIPDFVEGRLGDPHLRPLAAVVTLAISGLYIVPQLIGAARVLRAVTFLPYWSGIAITATVICVIVAFGGMRSATYMQAFEYAVKLFCIAVPAAVLLILVHPAERHAAVSSERASFAAETTVQLDRKTTLVMAAPITAVVSRGRGEPLHTEVLGSGEHVLPPGSRLVLPAGSPVPTVRGTNPLGGPAWRRPLLDLGGAGHPLFGTWSLLLATVLGTMGLPHILTRFHTTPTGRAARRTAVATIGLVGAFYVFPPVYGLLARSVAPQLSFTGHSDTVVVTLPGLALESGAGLLTAVAAAGAFAAFLSTSSGLLLTAGAAVSHDLLPRARSGEQEIRRLRAGVSLVAVAAAVVALGARDLDLGITVGWAFGLAASTFTPLLVLGIWTDRLTSAGAAAGLLTGTAVSAGAALVTVVFPPGRGWAAVLLAEPAGWSIAVSFLVMLGVSHLTAGSRRSATGALLLMHSADD
jgi:cation/acetate symporter